ncbi:MAG: HNH endonuclease [Synechococcaceae cyanobacterium RM1_1_27]|nr:HNH endonuclease [Synechococcaceae cyanobacterium RM1_1_27]
MREKKTPQRIPIPTSVRGYIFTRDKHQCQGCGKRDPKPNIQIDHIIPVAQGGSNDISNLQTLCRQCNQQKRDRMDPRFRPHF